MLRHDLEQTCKTAPVLAAEEARGVANRVLANDGVELPSYRLISVAFVCVEKIPYWRVTYVDRMRKYCADCYIGVYVSDKDVGNYIFRGG